MPYHLSPINETGTQLLSMIDICRLLLSCRVYTSHLLTVNSFLLDNLHSLNGSFACVEG